MIPNLPSKTIERLSQYRRILSSCKEQGKTHIYSHELASLLNNTAVQVRRDIMLIGHVGTLRKGYDIVELLNRIGEIIDSEDVLKVALVGAGKLGGAILSYFAGKNSKLKIVACFDVDPTKTGTEIEGVKCYPQSNLKEITKQENITIGIMTVPNNVASDVANLLVEAGIKGILNYTSTQINVPENVYLEKYDMVTSMEKVAYFVKHS